jgi:NTP pyrophosphatase (non-canonical NTP hydrolase)
MKLGEFKDVKPLVTDLPLSLVLIAEEAGEVVQEVTKILRFGLISSSPNYKDGRTNIQRLEAEIGDLLAVCELSGLLDWQQINDHKQLKIARLMEWIPDESN